MIHFDKIMREFLDDIQQRIVREFSKDLSIKLSNIANEYTAKAAEDLRKGLSALTFRMQKAADSDRYEIVIYTKLEAESK